MIGHRELQLDDYVAILRRRRWWIVVPAIILPILSYLVSLALPNRYRSQTVVLIVQQKVPDDYVRPVIAEDLNVRLATMQEQILSRTRLQPIIERFGLYREGITMEDRLNQMRKAISVLPIKSEYLARAGGMPGFAISFTGDSPRIAQQACSEITSMFMAENLRAREQAAQGTTDFLKSQLDDAKRNLDEQDRKLAAFKQAHVGQLPGEEQTNLSMLNALNNQLDAVNQVLARAQQDKTYADSMLNQQLAAWQASRSSADPNDLRQQLNTLQAQLTTLQVRYTDDHPDVIKTKAAIAEVKRKLEEADALTANVNGQIKAKSTASEPAAIQQLRLNIHNIEQTIREQTERQSDLQKQIRTYQARVQLSPVVEEQYKALTRDYETAQKFYDDLLAKRNQSAMATDLERQQQGEQFSILDPANLPEKPDFPNRPLFALGGLGGGLALGLIAAFILELGDKSLRNERDIEFYLETTTLTQIPVVGPKSKYLPRKRGGGWWRRRSRKQTRTAAMMQGEHV